MTARQVFFSGRVQGVGFRFSTKRIAMGFDVTGWVKNLDDGRVEMQVMADNEAEVEAFLEDIQQSDLRAHIKETVVNKIPPMTGVRGFAIVR